MRITIAHALLYLLVLGAFYFGGYWAGNYGYMDANLRPLFAAWHVPLKYGAKAYPQVISPNSAIGPVVAPMPTTVPPVPLVTLAAANELPSTDYAPI